MNDLDADGVTILESFWFNGPVGVAGLVVIDNGHEVKAYIAPMPMILNEKQTRPLWPPWARRCQLRPPWPFAAQRG